MFQRSIARIVTLSAIVLVPAAVAFAQSPTLPEPISTPTGSAWQVAQASGSAEGKLVVVTLDQPQRRQMCRVQSFTLEKLVCSRAIGGPRTYLPKQVLALIVPGDHGYKVKFVLWVNGASAAAIWGTVALAATCPACAVATGIVAVALLCAAGAVLIGDEQPDRLLYLAPGQQGDEQLQKLCVVPSLAPD